MVRGAQQIIAVARSHIGLHEEPHGSNDGPELRKVLAGTGFQPGEFWCMYFAIACVGEGLGGLMKLPASVHITGSCQQAADWARERRLLTTDAATGSIFVLADKAGHFHHAGIVSRVDIANQRIETIEGNSNNDGSRNGWVVVAHERPIHSVRYIIW